MNKQFERVRLRILATLAVLSITLCAVATVLWPISYATGVQLSVRNGKGVRYALVTVPGSLGLVVTTGEPPDRVSFDAGTKSFGTPTSTPTDPIRWYWNRPDTKLGFG